LLDKHIAWQQYEDVTFLSTPITKTRRLAVLGSTIPCESSQKGNASKDIYTHTSHNKIKP
jgi:hypothetical protein